MHLIYEQLKKDKTMSHANYKREVVKEDIESVLRGSPQRRFRNKTQQKEDIKLGVGIA